MILPVNRLKQLRKKIEKIDLLIINLIGERLKVTRKIQQIKKNLKLSVTQKQREKTLFNSYFKTSEKLFIPEKLIKKLFSLLFSYSKKPGIIKRKVKNI